MSIIPHALAHDKRVWADFGSVWRRGYNIGQWLANGQTAPEAWMAGTLNQHATHANSPQACVGRVWRCAVQRSDGGEGLALVLSGEGATTLARGWVTCRREQRGGWSVVVKACGTCEKPFTLPWTQGVVDSPSLPSRHRLCQARLRGLPAGAEPSQQVFAAPA